MPHASYEKYSVSVLLNVTDLYFFAKLLSNNSKCQGFYAQ